MKEIILTIGTACSGKSTWAKQLVQEQGYVEINRNDIRDQLFDVPDFKREQEDQVNDVVNKLAIDAVKQGKSIVISDTNLMVKYRNNWKTFSKIYGYKYKEQLFFMEWEEVLYRNSLRDAKHKIPQEELLKQYSRFMGIVKYREEKQWSKQNVNC